MFASPRALPRVQTVEGRVVVLDIAFAAQSGSSVSFEKTTRPFIEGLGERLAAWVDHHDHERHGDFADDPRFVLATKAEHGACPEMVTEDLATEKIVCTARASDHINMIKKYAEAGYTHVSVHQIGTG